MEQNQNGNIFDRNRILIKGFLIGFLILLMLIPKFMIQGMVNERAYLQTTVVNEISDKWASSQTVVGPVLIVPYNSYYKNKKGEIITTHNKAYILPDKLSINGDVVSEQKKRSIYQVTLYKSGMELSGNFSPATALQKLKINKDNIIWDECKVIMGITDAKGLEEEVQLNWDKNNSIMEPIISNEGLFQTELGSNVAFDVDGNSNFNIKLKLKGSTNLHFVPVGKTTDVKLKSNWQDPSFDGYYLPDTSNNKNGFAASWKILQVSRNYPQYWKDNNNIASQMYQSSFGVKLIQPADHYAKTERSVKYAILIIGLTFVVFFFVEIMQKVRTHPLQYILVGIALTIFYTLLLSISEYTGFNTAYMIAAIATVSLIGLYVWSVVKKGKVATGFTISLAGLYTYLFMLIQLKEYALISGSIGLFVVLAIIMYYSRKIDWYNSNKQINHNNE